MSLTQRVPLYQNGGVLTEMGASDMVALTDAAEDSAATSLPFTVSTSGDNTLLTPPSGKSIWLRRLTPTLADPDGSSTPLLKLSLGGTEIARGYVLSGRFNITGPVDGTLVLNLSKNGSVSGTVFYEVV